MTFYSLYYSYNPNQKERYNTMEKYNGYTNYPTWNVKLWIDNEEGSYNYWHDAAREAEDASDLARRLQEEHEEAAPDLGASTFSDMLGFAMGLVNWYEIAEMLIEDVKEG